MLSVAIVVFPGFQLLHLAPASVFEMANIVAEQTHYNVTLLSEHGGAVASSTGIAVSTEAFGAQRFDTVIIAGDNESAGGRSPALLQFLRNVSNSARRIAGPCTGAFALAAAGLLEGRRATTHWLHARTFRAAFPTVALTEDRIFVTDGAFWTSAGGTAGIDLALAMVEQDLGAELARDVAKKLVMSHRRSGGQAQFSALLELDAKSDRIQTALSWARANLRASLSVEQLASAASLSPRHFARAFRAETGQTPARAVERLRLEAARLLLEQGRHPVDTIARESGFGDAERMRRAFLRGYGQPPQSLRRARRAQAAVA